MRDPFISWLGFGEGCKVWGLYNKLGILQMCNNREAGVGNYIEWNGFIQMSSYIKCLKHWCDDLLMITLSIKPAPSFPVSKVFHSLKGEFDKG